jgi:hypothetical protein
MTGASAPSSRLTALALWLATLALAAQLALALLGVAAQLGKLALAL